MTEAVEPATDHERELMELIRRRRSVRRFEKGRSAPREVLLRIAEFGRWAPTGANAQCWDLVIVEDARMRAQVLDVFLRQSQRLVGPFAMYRGLEDMLDWDDADERLGM